MREPLGGRSGPSAGSLRPETPDVLPDRVRLMVRPRFVLPFAADDTGGVVPQALAVSTFGHGPVADVLDWEESYLATIPPRKRTGGLADPVAAARPRPEGACWLSGGRSCSGGNRWPMPRRDGFPRSSRAHVHTPLAHQNNGRLRLPPPLVDGRCPFRKSRSGGARSVACPGRCSCGLRGTFRGRADWDSPSDVRKGTGSSPRTRRRNAPSRSGWRTSWCGQAATFRPA